MKQVWLDLETTGLVIEDGAILEVGLIVVSGDGTTPPEEVDYEAVVGGLGSDWTDMLPPVVEEMHLRNGLLNEVNGDDSLPLEVIEAQVVDLLSQFGEPGEFWLCGSGVAEFDRRWIDAYMPNLAKWFHYRSIDMGIIRRWLREIGVTEDYGFVSENETPHRALPDAQHALDEHRWYSGILADHLMPEGRT